MECSNGCHRVLTHFQPLNASSSEVTIESKEMCDYKQKITLLFETNIKYLNGILQQHKEINCSLGNDCLMQLHCSKGLATWIELQNEFTVSRYNTISLSQFRNKVQALAQARIPAYKRPEAMEMVKLPKLLFYQPSKSEKFYQPTKCFSYSKEDYFIMKNLFSNYCQYLRVVKKDCSLPYYQTTEVDKINENNANLTFDLQLLKQIPEQERQTLCSYIKPYMFGPDGIVYAFIDTNETINPLQFRRTLYLVENKEEDKYYLQIEDTFSYLEDYQGYDKFRERKVLFSFLSEKKAEMNALSSLTLKYLRAIENQISKEQKSKIAEEIDDITNGIQKL